MTVFTKMCAMTVSGLIAAAATAPAYAAADNSQVVSVKVSHADLDLATQAGRTQLDRRLLAATDKVCGAPQTINLAEAMAINQCRTQAISSARAAASVAVARVETNTMSTR